MSFQEMLALIIIIIDIIIIVVVHLFNVDKKSFT